MLDAEIFALAAAEVVAALEAASSCMAKLVLLPVLSESADEVDAAGLGADVLKSGLSAGEDELLDSDFELRRSWRK